MLSKIDINQPKNSMILCSKPLIATSLLNMSQEIEEYNQQQIANDFKICDLLCHLIEENLPESESKIWHKHPVWFLNGNPIVGYSKQKNEVRLLFWSGQSFEEEGLLPAGKFKAAEAKFIRVEQVNKEKISSWLTKAKTIQWDYKNIVKRKGVLERL